VVDLEATCFENPKKPDINEIIEIGIVLCDADYNILYKWSSFVQPKINRHLSNFCKKLTSIKQFEIDQAMQFVDVAQLFQKE
jgi:3'-5' exoribonuclease 1